MESEWQTSSFENAPLLIEDGDRGVNYPKRTEFSKTGHCLFLNTGNVTLSGFDFSTTDFISKNRDNLLRKGKLCRHDVVLTTRGTVGNVAYFDEQIPFDHIRINSGMVIFRPDQTKLHPRFLYLFLRSNLFTTQVKALQTGSAQPQLPIRDIRKISFSFPGLAQQKAIAHILGSLDDKIELNRRMNTTLEAMAQALFKSWFVDFDPVIDNALAAGYPIPEPLQERAEARAALGDQRQPLPEAIRQQFPNSFVCNEDMGWVPEGWNFARFAEAAHVVMGQSPTGDTYNSDGQGTPLVNGPVEFGEYFAQKTKWTTAPSKCCNVGDLIVCVRGSTTGRYVKADGEYCLGRGVCAIQGKISQAFADQTFKANIDPLLLMTTGSTFPNWSGPTLNNFSIVLPPNYLLHLFEDQAGNITQKIESNCFQNEMLSQLRDTLLPELLSGQLRIPEAEQQGADMP
ncbi:MAG: restriction endonuclease subunit S [Desulfobulbus sp.]|nr:restriction endonuclease subunit S [Desulfobulbus sp.]